MVSALRRLGVATLADPGAVARVERIEGLRASIKGFANGAISALDTHVSAE